MDVSLSETQRLIRDSIREYAEREVLFSRIRAVEASRGMDSELWQELSALGWLALPFQERYGGQAGDLTDTGVLIEELTRRAVLIPLVETFAAGITIQRYASEDVARDIINRILDGSVTISPAVLEANDRFDEFTTRVGPDGLIRGTKYFVDYGQLTSHHLVAATSEGRVGLYLVARDDPNVSAKPVTNIGKIPQAIVTYEGARAVQVADESGYTFLRNLARTFAGVQCVACSQQSLDMTVAYVGMRVQFGRPIGTFQAVQHHCANMATHTLASRFLVYEALWKLERAKSTDEEIAFAKAQASRTASEVPMMAHQLHGGMGLVTEYDLHFFSLRGKQAALSWGSSEECLQIVAKLIEEPTEWL